MSRKVLVNVDNAAFEAAKKLLMKEHPNANVVFFTEHELLAHVAELDRKKVE